MNAPHPPTSIAELLDHVTVEEAMHVGVISCSFETPLREVASLMAEHRVHCVVGLGDLTEGDTLLWGVISDLDLVADAAVEGADARSAASVAATEVVTVHGHESLRHAADLMREHAVSHLLVVARGPDTPIGVLSALDIAAVIAGRAVGPPRRRETSRVEDLMTTPALTVYPDLPLRDLAALLVEHGISGVPVVRDGTLLGVVSEADIVARETGEAPRRKALLRRLLEDGAEPAAARFAAGTAGEAMTSPAITVAPWRSAASAAALMVERGIKRLPVVREGRLVGIVTRSDLVRAFARSDEELEREISKDVIDRGFWIGPGRVTVSVQDGEVTLRGQIDSTVDAELLPRAVQSVPGVVSVRSELAVREYEA